MKLESAALSHTLASLRPLCAALPGAEEYTMVHHPAFRVGKKPFLIVGLDAHGARADAPCVSINLGRDVQGDLLDDARFSRTPYLGQHGWVTVALASLRKGELPKLIEESWRRVAKKRDLAAFTAARGR